MKIQLIVFFMISIAVFLNFPFITPVFAGPVGLPNITRPEAVPPEFASPITPPSSSTQSVDIPSVVERPFDINEGDIIVVNKFRLLGAENLPEFGISLDDIHAILNEHNAQKPEGFTIGQLQEVATAVTNYYRNAGLILAQAVVPVQTVEDGTVDIELFIGRLGRVLVEGNQLYATHILQQPFSQLVGQPIDQAQIESALLTLTDYFGLSIFGIFQPGLHVGTADIVLKVQEESKYDVTYRFDTHGTRETGRTRLQSIIDWNSILGFADRLTLSGQRSFNPKNNFFVALDYARFLPKGFQVGGSYDINAFDVGGEFADSEISTRTESQSIFLEKSFLRSRQKNLSTRISFTRKHSNTRASGNNVNTNRLSVLGFSVDFDSVDTFSFSDEGGGINFAYLELDRGFNNLLGAMGSASEAALLPVERRTSRTGGAANALLASGQFSKLFASYTRLQTIATHHSVLLKAEYQWSPDLLTPLEQYSVGGPNNVRAFPNAQVLWDRAYFASFEWLFNAPFFADEIAFSNRTWGELLQLTAFYDVATGRLNSPLDSEQQNHNALKGVGLGLRFAVPGLFRSQFSIATDIGTDVPSNGRSFQLWGDMTYNF
ncbi:Hemolysin activation/secretion protein [uncultured Candidatus Thioglobus sp.]|nr:Hemolysin activation/secretion protein [uncultured Candidatus Thioglobus sp.]